MLVRVCVCVGKRIMMTSKYHSLVYHHTTHLNNITGTKIGYVLDNNAIVIRSLQISPPSLANVLGKQVRTDTKTNSIDTDTNTIVISNNKENTSENIAYGKENASEIFVHRRENTSENIAYSKENASKNISHNEENTSENFACSKENAGEKFSQSKDTR